MIDSSIFIIYSIGGIFLFFKFDVDERLYPCSTDGTIVILHPHDLTTALAQAKMSTRQDDCIFYYSEANDALSLNIILLSGGSCILLPVHIRQIKNCLVVQ